MNQEMERPRGFRGSAALALICLLAGAGAAAAQGGPRQSDEEACQPDVFRLCASSIPDESAIVACLNANATSLSPACRAVIAPETLVKKRRPRR